MKQIAALIDVALESLKLDVTRAYNPNPSTDPYIVYNCITKSPNLFGSNAEKTRTFYIDVDIYTQDATLIDDVSEEVEKKLKEHGFKFLPSGDLMIEDDITPTVYHVPLEFSYEKRMYNGR